jgi:DNA-binding ferritin-like protein
MIVRTFLDILNLVKLYHWKTRSYAQHKATDELYAKLNDHIDTFVEVLLGKDQSRIDMVEDKCRRYCEAKTTEDIQSRMHKFRRFLSEDIGRIFSTNTDTDLLNVRDEILGDINQFLYLMSFK